MRVYVKAVSKTEVIKKFLKIIKVLYNLLYN